MFHHVAVKHEASYDFRIGERNDEFGLARFPISRWRNAEGVAKAVEISRSAVHFCDKEPGLMNMKVVVQPMQEPKGVGEARKQKSWIRSELDDYAPASATKTLPHVEFDKRIRVAHEERLIRLRARLQSPLKLRLDKTARQLVDS